MGAQCAHNRFGFGVPSSSGAVLHRAFGRFVRTFALRIFAAAHVRPPDNVGQGGINPPSRMRIVCKEAGELGAGVVKG